MSADTLTRTVFYCDWGGVVRFYDWAVINHPGLGRCYQPFFVNQFIPIGDQDNRVHLNYENADYKVTQMQPFDFDKLPTNVFCDQTTGMQLHGGLMYPRTGR